MNNIIIRDYCKGDYEKVDFLWNEINLGGKHRGDNEDTIENTIKNGGKLFILEEKETARIIGTSWLTNDKRRIYLHHFGIDPKYQGKGYSKLLLDKSLKYAQKQGLQIKLEVHKDNNIAIDLYKKYGFKYLGDYIVFIIRDIVK